MDEGALGWPAMLDVLALGPALDEGLTPARLREIWQRASAAPPGPWHVVADGRGRCVVHPHDPRQPAAAAPGAFPETTRGEAHDATLAKAYPLGPAGADPGAQEAACALLAQAREDLLAMIGEVVRLHALLERLGAAEGTE